MNSLDFRKEIPKLVGALVQVSAAIRSQQALEPRLLELVYLRAAQLNGCGFCAEMHVEGALSHGEHDERLHAVAIWRSSARFSERERAALELTEATTRLDRDSHGAYALAERHFTKAELSVLVFALSITNAWNRLNVVCATEAELGREAARTVKAAS
jgi:AhpD family alkylhydroperoxidase